jgi:pyruvate formate lyase activating enzyme
MCVWIREHLGDSVPLHLSRFHPQYRLKDLPPTPVERLEAARRIALDAGLRYVYIGNVPGHVANSTFCPTCGRRLIYRIGYSVDASGLESGACPACGSKIEGVWE